MFCNKCGEILRDGTLRCPACGAVQKKDSKINTKCDCKTNKKLTFSTSTRTHSTFSGVGEEKKNTYSVPTPPNGIITVGDFWDLIKAFFRRSLDFGGRSSRWEFWWTYLFIFLTVVMLSDFLPLMILWFLVILVPFLALGVRRLHDIGKSGKLLLIKIIPVFGVIQLIVWFCQPSAPANQWGRPAK